MIPNGEEHPLSDLAAALVARELELDYRRRGTLWLAGAALAALLLALALGPRGPVLVWLAAWLAGTIGPCAATVLAYHGLLLDHIVEHPREYACAHLALRFGSRLAHPKVDDVGSWAGFVSPAPVLLAVGLLYLAGECMGVDWGSTAVLLVVFAALLHVPLFFAMDRVVWYCHGRNALQRRASLPLVETMHGAGFVRHWWHGWVPRPPSA